MITIQIWFDLTRLRTELAMCDSARNLRELFLPNVENTKIDVKNTSVMKTDVRNRSVIRTDVKNTSAMKTEATLV